MALRDSEVTTQEEPSPEPSAATSIGGTPGKQYDQARRKRLTAGFLALAGAGGGYILARTGIPLGEAKTSAQEIRDAIASSTQGIPVPLIDGDVSNPSDGDLWEDYTTGNLRYHNGFRGDTETLSSGWHNLAGAASVTVSPVGTSEGYPRNNGATFGPDTQGTSSVGLNEALATSLVVVVLPGDFYPSVEIAVTRGNSHLMGVGGGTRIHTAGDNRAVLINSEAVVDGVVVEGIRFFGSGRGAGSSNNGVDLSYTTNCAVRNCTFQGFAFHAIFANNSIGLEVTGNWVDGADGFDGISVTQGSSYCIVSHNFVSNVPNGYAGLDLNGVSGVCSYNLYTANVVSNCGWGVGLDTAAYNTIEGNVIDRVVMGVNISNPGCHHTKVIGNSISNSTGSGGNSHPIQDFADYTYVEGNRFENFSDGTTPVSGAHSTYLGNEWTACVNGLQMYNGPSACFVGSNSFIDIGGTAIHVLPGATNTMIVGNRFDGNGTDVTDAGTGTIVKGPVVPGAYPGIKRITYTGNGAASRLLTVGFTPKQVVILSSVGWFAILIADQTHAVIGSSGMGADGSPPSGQVFLNGTQVDVGSLDSLRAASANQSGTAYTLYATE